MSRFRSPAALMAAALLLAACGGGGGDSAPPVAQVPVTPPVVTVPPTKITIAVNGSSYENAKNIGVGPQAMPVVDPTFVEQINNGYAYADFDKSNILQMVAFTEIVPRDGSHRVTEGKVRFYKKGDNDTWVENTSAMVDDTSGCIIARKVIVADFNNDGKPDAFAACSGLDFGAQAGENQRMLLSTADGKYKNILIQQKGYVHGAAAADVNRDGNIDIVLADMRGQGGKTPLYFLMGNGQGGFMVDYERAARQEYEFKQKFWSVELVKNTNGEYDLLAGGSESDTATTLIRGVNGNYATSPATILPPMPSFNTVMDFILEGETAYLLRTTEKYEGSAIQKVNVRTGEASTIYQHTGYYDGQYMGWGVTWVNWIVPFNNTIVSSNSFYKVSVPK